MKIHCMFIRMAVQQIQRFPRWWFCWHLNVLLREIQKANIWKQCNKDENKTGWFLLNSIVDKISNITLYTYIPRSSSVNRAA